MKKIFTVLLTLKLIVLTLMWLSSYTHYTSIGVDIDTQKDNNITHHFYRVRWPANGSIWFGGGNTQRSSDPSKHYEPFDLAATFFYANPQRPEVKSTLNAWGFWHQSAQKPNKQTWVGIPSWVPAIFILLIILNMKPYSQIRERR
ncbi:MAG: hypothetical protein V3V19_00840 [Cocleimonas sp.]